MASSVRSGGRPWIDESDCDVADFAAQALPTPIRPITRLSTRCAQAR